MGKCDYVCVLEVSLPPSPPFKQRGEYVCNVCIFSVLQKKKKKTEKKWKGSLSLSFIKPSCACCYSAYSLILQLIQFLDNPLSNPFSDTKHSKAYLLLTVSYHNYYSFINSKSPSGLLVFVSKNLFLVFVVFCSVSGKILPGILSSFIELFLRLFRPCHVAFCSVVVF